MQQYDWHDYAEEKRKKREERFAKSRRFNSKEVWQFFLDGNQVIDIEDVPYFERWSERSKEGFSFEVGWLDRADDIAFLKEAGRLQL